jgi:hypothetical protein
VDLPFVATRAEAQPRSFTKAVRLPTPYEDGGDLSIPALQPVCHNRGTKRRSNALNCVNQRNGMVKMPRFACFYRFGLIAMKCLKPGQLTYVPQICRAEIDRNMFKRIGF